MPRAEPKPNTARLVDVDELKPFPGNAWRGDVGAIARSLEALDQYKPVVVNLGGKRTKGTVLAGNHTRLAALELGWKQIRVWFVEVDDETAKKINVADNRIPQLGEYDDPALAELLGSIAEAGEEALLVTGFDQPTLEGLLVPDPDPPAEFPLADPDDETDFKCPGCGYEWSGNPK